MSVDEIKTGILRVLPTDGSKEGHKSVRKVIGLQETDLQNYWAAVRQLQTENLAVSIRGGNGGSIVRVVVDTQQETQIPKEDASLYAAVVEYVRNHFAPSWGLTERDFLTHVTAWGGRRADGPWKRPDVTLIYVEKYRYLPGKELKVVTLEVKESDLSIQGVYECLSHAASANFSILAIRISDQEAVENQPMLEDIQKRCARHGLGLWTLSDANDPETYNERLAPLELRPDKEELHTFIEAQLKPLHKELALLIT